MRSAKIGGILMIMLLLFVAVMAAVFGNGSKPKRVIELIRVSTDGQAEDDRGGIPAQHAINLRTAAQYGLEIVQSYTIVVSGNEVLNAPEVQTLLGCIRRGEVDGVVVCEFSRLTRQEKLGEMGTILDAFADAGATLYLPDGPIDFASQSARMLAAIRGAIAVGERWDIRKRIMAGKEALRRMGRWVAGDRQLPYGVAYDRKTYKFSYKPEAEKVREIFHQ